MKTLTNKDKLRIYKLALKNFHKYTCMCKNFHKYTYMCPCISDAYDEIFKTDSTLFYSHARKILIPNGESIEVLYAKLFELLPEFLALKPKHRKVYNCWWDRDNRSIRIKYFNKLIKELEAIQ